MAKIKLGELCAYIPPKKTGQKARYLRIGTAFFEEDNPERLSIIIDTIPTQNSGWEGWCNIFSDRETSDREQF